MVRGGRREEGYGWGIRVYLWRIHVDIWQNQYNIVKLKKIKKFFFFKSESEVAQSCLTLCDPMDCSLPGSSVHGIFQARVLDWGAIAFSCKLDYLESNASAQQENTNKMKRQTREWGKIFADHILDRWLISKIYK